jgi:hypothetical protein
MPELSEPTARHSKIRFAQNGIQQAGQPDFLQ